MILICHALLLGRVFRTDSATVRESRYSEKPRYSAVADGHGKLCAPRGARITGNVLTGKISSAGDQYLRATVIDARRGEVYAALYDAAGRQAVEESVRSFPRFLDRVSEREFEWIATDVTPFRAAIAGTRFEKFPVITAPRALAGAIARIAIRRALAGDAQQPAAIEANYARRSDAELLWKPDAR